MKRKRRKLTESEKRVRLIIAHCRLVDRAEQARWTPIRGAESRSRACDTGSSKSPTSRMKTSS